MYNLGTVSNSIGTCPGSVWLDKRHFGQKEVVTQGSKVDTDVDVVSITPGLKDSKVSEKGVSILLRVSRQLLIGTVGPKVF